MRQPFRRTLPTAPDSTGQRAQAPAHLPRRLAQTGLQQNAILHVLCGDLSVFFAISGHLEGEVATQIAPEADLLETCPKEQASKGRLL